jgi:alpha-amylase/alpha-mannosidase (GH57 family)
MSETDGTRLHVVLCWHMHQPDYRHAETGIYRAPWTYLHAIKDYADMAWHLETNPDARVVVNFSPVLLEQLQDYATWISSALSNGSDPRDPLLAELYNSHSDLDTARRHFLLTACINSNARVIDRFPHYKALVDVARFAAAHPETIPYLGNQYYSDLVVWYHLVWCGEAARRSDPLILKLEDKQHGYTADDRRQLMQWIGRSIEQLIPRYRALAARGQVELSTSPYSHPILPLLLDFASARESRPQIALPSNASYPGGAQRARWQLDEARRRFAAIFDGPPTGCWPSEGAVSTDALHLIRQAGFRWAASALGVLVNSESLPHDSDHFHRAYRIADGPVCFFRDDGLSDRIGFLYKDWDAEDAVRDFISQLEALADQPRLPGRVVSIILDGENAWDSYAENGYRFLRNLYVALADHPKLNLCTFSDYLDADDLEMRTLESVCAGSWVYGGLDTWIGAAAKNAGWDRLVELKQAFDAWLEQEHDEIRRRIALEQLAMCESSDWFWWLGSGNAPEAVTAFDAGLREQLAALYRYIGLAVPPVLNAPLGHAEPGAKGGVMLPGYFR